MKDDDIKNLDITDEMISEGRSYTGIMPDDMPKYMAKTIKSIDYFSLSVGRVVAWITVIVFLSMFYEVIARKFFLSPTMWAYDVSRMFAGAMFMLGAGYALSKGIHIRADFIYRNWSDRSQAWVDGVLYILFYFPGLITVFVTAYDYAYLSWIRGELGMDTAWMPVMYPIKSVLAIGVLFLIIQGVSEFLKCVYAIQKGRWP